MVRLASYLQIYAVIIQAISWIIFNFGNILFGMTWQTILEAIVCFLDLFIKSRCAGNKIFVYLEWLWTSFVLHDHLFENDASNLFEGAINSIPIVGKEDARLKCWLNTKTLGNKYLLFKVLPLGMFKNCPNLQMHIFGVTLV